MSSSFMAFCEICNNKCTIAVIDLQLSQMCRACGHINTIQDRFVVSRVTYREPTVFAASTTAHVEQLDVLKQYVNPYTKYDPTLETTTTVPCPNVDCICNKHVMSDDVDDTPGDAHSHYEVKKICYDPVNLLFLYLCVHCDTVWKM